MSVTVNDSVFVTAHAGRAFIHDAAQFKTEKAVVLEYVLNGLQYRPKGSYPRIAVKVSQSGKTITIEDNGSGMSLGDLQHFFQMHGNNRDRLMGNQGRGKFGTGKSAAFAIADKLTVQTTKDGLRNTLELSRSDILSIQNGQPIPVKSIEHQVASKSPAGTLITISDIQLSRIDLKSIREYLEIHTTSYKDAHITLNGRALEYNEPMLSGEPQIFVPRSPETIRLLGPVELTIKVAQGPVPTYMRGISIRANGTLLEQTLEEASGKDFANYIFGEIDVPCLDENNSETIPAFDSSRSMRLNRKNEKVAALVRFISPKIEQVRKSLADAEKRHQSEISSTELDQTASVIAKVISDDWTRNNNVNPSSTPYHPHPQKKSVITDDGRVVHKEPTQIDVPKITKARNSAPEALPESKMKAVPHLDEEPQKSSPPSPNGMAENSLYHQKNQPLPINLPKDFSSEQTDNPPVQKQTRRSFSVEFRNIGPANEAGVFEPDENMIIINLEHPKFLKILHQEGGTQNPHFLKSAFDTAVMVYAMAFIELRAQRQFYLSHVDMMIDLRSTVDRTTRNVARLIKG